MQSLPLAWSSPFIDLQILHLKFFSPFLKKKIGRQSELQLYFQDRIHLWFASSVLQSRILERKINPRARRLASRMMRCSFLISLTLSQGAINYQLSFRGLPLLLLEKPLPPRLAKIEEGKLVDLYVISKHEWIIEASRARTRLWCSNNRKLAQNDDE